MSHVRKYRIEKIVRLDRIILFKNFSLSLKLKSQFSLAYLFDIIIFFYYINSQYIEYIGYRIILTWTRYYNINYKYNNLRTKK
jgi:hypothetical protein